VSDLQATREDDHVTRNGNLEAREAPPAQGRRRSAPKSEPFGAKCGHFDAGEQVPARPNDVHVTKKERFGASWALVATGAA